MQKDQTDVVEMTNKVHIQRMTELLAATNMYMYVGMILWNVAIYIVVLVYVFYATLWFATLKIVT